MPGPGASTGPGSVPSGRRLFEWGLMLAAILGLALLFMQQAQRVQGQAELAAIKSTLGALRMAAVQEDLRNKVSGHGGSPAAEHSNPFELLQFRPGNYLGSLDASQALAVRPGGWWFDPNCVCVVYAPLEPQWLVGASGLPRLRFRVDVSASPMQLRAIEAYSWQGQRLE